MKNKTDINYDELDLGLVDEYIASFRPSSLMLRTSYIAIKNQAIDAFDPVKSFFSDNPHRRAAIHMAQTGTYDYSPDGSEIITEELPVPKYMDKLPYPSGVIREALKIAPPLYEIITKISFNVYLHTALWRGKARWPVKEYDYEIFDAFRTDAEMGPTLNRIQAHEGFSLEDWQEFQLKLLMLRAGQLKTRSK